jgi:hypothetical protein
LPVEARIFLAALAFRVASAFLALLSNIVFADVNDQGFGVFRGQDHQFWDAFARYDAGWYHGIASEGYHYKGEGRNNLAFFPAYPLLMRAGGLLLGGRQQDFYFAGIVISWLAFAGAMVLLYRVALLDLARPAALRAVLYAAVFPGALFFGMVYSESLYLLMLLAAVYGLRTQRLAVAGVAGAVMTATRATAVTAVPGLALVAWTSSPALIKTRAALAASVAVGGIAAFSAFNYMVSGNPFTWYESITFWGYHPGAAFPFATLLTLVWGLVTRPYDLLTAERMAPYDAINALAALLALALVPLIWRRFNAGYALIVLAAMMLPLSSGVFEGLARYTSVQFPVALALASLTGETRHGVLLATSAALYGICLALFVNVHPLF